MILNTVQLKRRLSDNEDGLRIIMVVRLTIIMVDNDHYITIRLSD